ncbi:MAG: aminotransferase class V-fold PLP-dependent enzyme [Gammaproteobacteria bacterium]
MKHPEFPLSDKIFYLNHAAVAPWPLRTSRAVEAFAEQNCKYGSLYYPDWLKQEAELREQLRRLLNAPSVEDIALVKNTSEAISFVAYGLDWQPGDNIVSSNEEFPSNRIPWQSLAPLGVEFREADLHQNDSPEQALFDQVDAGTRLLTVSSIQFASGLRLDLQRIGRFCKQRNILFCIDAIQSLGAVEFDVQDYHADFVMADGHKWMLGPEGLGVFYSTPEAREKLMLTQFGWHMMKNTHNYENKPWEIHPGARRFECGSPNMLGIHALSSSLSLLLDTGIDRVEQAVLKNANQLMEGIAANDNLELLTDRQAKLKSGIVVFRHKSKSNAELFAKLQAEGVMCAQRGQGVRFSPHFYHSEEELGKVLTILEAI